MSGLPSGWETATIEELTSNGPAAITDGPFGSALKRSHYTEAGARVIRLGNLGEGSFIDNDKAFVPMDHYETLQRHKVLAGDILVAALGEPLGRACRAPTHLGPAIVKADCFRVRPHEAVSASLLVHWLNSPRLREDILGSSHGLGRIRINLSDLKSLRVPVPPETEQRRIVAKIDSLSCRSARARHELDLVPNLIERYKQAILRAAFKGVLTADWRAANPDTVSAQTLLSKVQPPEQPRGGREATDSVTPGMAGLSVNHPNIEPPEGWQWTPLLRIARQETGHTPSRSKSHYWDGGIPWIGIKDANIHHGKIINTTLQTVSPEGLENSSARLLPEGTVCLSRTASVGYVTMMGRSMATSQDFATWTCSSALLPKYLMYALMAEGDDIRKFGEGSTHTTIYFPEIRALHICLAPLNEQAEIVRRIELALDWIDKIATEHARAAHLLPKLDQAILAKAFRGELVPQDPNDEPASALLERIKAERDTDNGVRRGRRSKT